LLGSYLSNDGVLELILIILDVLISGLFFDLDDLKLLLKFLLLLLVHSNLDLDVLVFFDDFLDYLVVVLFDSLLHFSDLVLGLLGVFN